MCQELIQTSSSFVWVVLHSSSSQGKSGSDINPGGLYLALVPVSCIHMFCAGWSGSGFGAGQ